MAERETGKTSRGGRQTLTTPEEFTTASPHAAYPSGDFTYILEIVMNMQTSMGKLIEAVDSLKTQARDQDRKHDEVVKEIRAVSQDVNSAKVVAKVMGGVIAFVGFMITAAIAIVGYIAIPVLFKLLDIGSEILKKTH